MFLVKLKKKGMRMPLILPTIIPTKVKWRDDDWRKMWSEKKQKKCCGINDVAKQKKAKKKKQGWKMKMWRENVATFCVGTKWPLEKWSILGF